MGGTELAAENQVRSVSFSYHKVIGNTRNCRQDI